MEEGCLTIILIDLALIVLFIGALAIGFIGEKFTCKNKWSAFENKFGVFSNCQIKVNGNWIPAESYYIKEDLKEKE